MNLTEVRKALADPEGILTRSEVALICGVNPTTVRRWAEAEKIQESRTRGGHARYRVADVRKFLHDRHHITI